MERFESSPEFLPFKRVSKSVIAFWLFFSILAQPFYLSHLLQHMDVQVFVQLPRVLRSRHELAENSKFWGLARSLNSWIEKILNFR
jgi:hypothetical protein